MKSKTVLLIIPHLSIGGTEMQTFNIAAALVDEGYTVIVLCLYRCIPEVVERFSSIGAKVELLSPQYNKREIKIKYQKGPELWRFLYNGLKNVITKYQPKIVHVQYMTPGATIILMLKCVFHQQNIIATTHTAADIYTTKSLKLFRFLTRYCLRAMQCITLAAERSYFNSAGYFNGTLPLKKGNHFTIYNSLPPHISVLQEDRTFHSDIITVGVVSRLEKIKGMDLVVPAFAKAFNQNKQLRLLVVGGGSLDALMKEQVRDFGLSEYVSFSGRVSPKELQSKYDKIDILLMPSRSEGFGLTALEGMARGCVVVASEVGGLPEVIQHDTTGILHKPEDTSAIAQAILQAAAPETLAAMSAAALRRSALFSSEEYKKQIASWYNILNR